MANEPTESLRSCLGRTLRAETVDGSDYLRRVFERTGHALGPPEGTLIRETKRVVAEYFPERRVRLEEDFALLRPASWEQIEWELLDQKVCAHYRGLGLSCALDVTETGYEVTGPGVRKVVMLSGAQDVLVQVFDYSVEKRN